MFNATTARLGAMMFLQYFVWGAWYVTIGNYMAAQGMADLAHWPYTVNPIAAIVAPFFLGLVADRFFAGEKVLGVLHILGGLIMFVVPLATGNPSLFVLLLLLYNLCYMPTIGLANSLAFHNIENQERQFPMIRVFGTIGWIHGRSTRGAGTTPRTCRTTGLSTWTCGCLRRALEPLRLSFRRDR